MKKERLYIQTQSFNGDGGCGEQEKVLKIACKNASKTRSHGVPNTPDPRLISCCICYQHHYYALTVALTGEGTQASTYFF